MFDLKKWIAKVTNAISGLPSLTGNSLVVVKNISLTSSGSINAGATCAVKSTDISSHIPQGYKLLFASLRGTQNGAAVCWYFEFFPNNNTLEYRLRNVGSSAITTSPTANILCVKE